ncbi:alpha/beta hydrolase [Actinoplanes sp. TBRC 11911]|uniref:alpha/beta hydrolase n=1 Tax=Actinoplanes sp. TBRC 11911 TaxID=2729386 RepID=UPI001B7D5DFF|nr:alpha/beta hydrolase [Actinoplanes sp. TBRC 11911]
MPVGDVVSRRAGINAAHAMVDAAPGVPGDVVTTDFSTTASDGATLLLRWYVKEDSIPGPAVLFFHGSGMIASSVSLYDGTVSRFVSSSGVPFLSVEYRLAPEFPHPTPVEDGYAALTWLAEHAGDLGVDPARIAVMGDSGGGNVAASLALLARDRGGPALAKQILLYPALDDRTIEPDPELDGLYTWSYDDNETIWRAFLGNAYGTDNVSAYAAPARASDLAGLPPLYMEALELDILRDEDLQYARRCSLAGVPTELHLHSGVVHAFETMAFNTDIARRIQADRIRYLRTI